ncbi:sporulation inhibitor of replication protein SirA [Aquibacillus halophilus]|uniref:Sporulation inhibitor of replication protein SirA n=1 Tax=Aquibacillus halophilus TaxID=930132 RepID=A0A6A8DI79_9BACI|nr:sporulation inhibitor of replication protein SirA [Aquibacillus halophilus]MRH42617.1 sporulation inhibitor of replication protein SirA [Aquibacillus halophilus]
MHKYSVFWIKEEFHYNYFYKPDILYRFLNEYVNNSIPSKYLDSQFNYITHTISYNSLLEHLRQYHNYQININASSNRMDCNIGDKSLNIYIKRRNLVIESNSVEEVDTLVFQPLKNISSSFFVIELGTTNSGWITPVKKEVLL